MSGSSNNNSGEKITFLPAYKIGFLDKVNFSLNIKGNNENIIHTVHKELEVRGPESIIAIDHKMISRINPPNGDVNFEPNYFPYIDFTDLDFPWRYSNSDADQFKSHNAVPWLCIIVLSEPEIENLKSNNIDVFSKVNDRNFLTLTSDLLPDLKESWGSAHVQLINFNSELKDLGADHLEQWINDNPNNHSSRLLCLNHLKEKTTYQAFLVPSYKDSLVPHNLAPSTTSNELGWSQASVEIVKLPIYYQWSFTTSKKGDFEYLVRKLKAGKVEGEIGTRRVDSSFTLDKEDNEKIHKHSFSREGALVSANYQGGYRPNYFKSFEDDSEDKQEELIESMNVSLQGNKKIKKPRSKSKKPRPKNKKLNSNNFSKGQDNKFDFGSSNKNKDVRRGSSLSDRNMDRKRRGHQSDQDKEPRLNPNKIRDFKKNLLKHQSSVDGILDQIYDYKINMQTLILDLPKMPIHKEVDDEPDPLITFPVYGRYYQHTNEIITPRKQGQKVKWNSWIDELNCDWRYRLSASFGTKTVQNNQDIFSEQCWEQVGEIRAANEKLRLAKMSYYLNKNIYNKHLTKISNEHFSVLTTPFHLSSKVNVEDKEMSVKEMLAKSGVPSGTFSIPFMKMAAQKNLKSNLYNNEELFAVYEKASAEESHTESVSENKNEKPIGDQTNLSQFLCKSSGISGDIPGWKTINILPFVPIISLIAPGSLKIAGFEQPIVNTTENMYSNNILETVNTLFKPTIIYQNLSDQLSSIIKFNDGRRINSTFDPIMSYPTIDEPMYEYLQKLSMDYIVPGMDSVENNVIFLMRENRRFIESFMVGLNHEMGRELLWREFPTDQRGTVFSRFWDYSNICQDEDGNLLLPPDIDEIHTFNGKLGTNKYTDDQENESSEQESDVVLVIKGEIVNRYPDMQIYALKCKTELTLDKLTDLSESNTQVEEMILPSLRANLGKNTIIVGFPFSAVEALAKEEKMEDYYFVLQEQQDLPTFGLDLDPSEDDMSWDDINLDGKENGYINKVDDSFGLQGKKNVDSAFVAKMTYQKPMRVIYSAKRLIP